MTILILIVAVALIIFCIIGWFSSYVSRIAMIYYMKINNLRMPNDAEIKECIRETIKHLFK